MKLLQSMGESVGSFNEGLDCIMDYLQREREFRDPFAFNSYSQVVEKIGRRAEVLFLR